jgi:hypothetical protein
MRRRGGFAQHGWRSLRPAWIAAVVLAVASLPIGASAGYFAQQAQMCQPREVQLSQYVPEVKQRCRWVKDCQTDFETEQRCQQVQQCQMGHCYPVPHCFDVQVPHRTCYPRQVCR